MLGAIAGDIIGSVHERNPVTSMDFPLFQPASTFTDDTVLTVAVAQAILEGIGYAEALRLIGRRYPNCGYGTGFSHWLFSNGPAYYSWGNGAAMRVSPVGIAFNDLEKVLQEAAASAAVSHDHPEGIKGAQAVAAVVFLARRGLRKPEIKKIVETRFGYHLEQSIAQIRRWYRFDVSCQGSVPQAITAFLEAVDFENAVRLAVSLGGDSDTLASMAGAMAQAFYGPLPSTIERQVLSRLPADLLEIIGRFQNAYPQG